ncbi:hypothetical protein N7478_003425 [Penicillium angulare]|uniref:uncharacterized protein n=1 Tax=Penicillium angulare TaxID=116970 RepID=UPI002541F72F|nr:uncharacterized protein N7478_003425 [Penicillium angulare]KAJ5287739.1 hypothetical protein N7478_003425 [Penicillium angulare]
MPDFGSDLAAQIERCEERIQEGIVPWLFEDQLRSLRARMTVLEKVMARFPGVSPHVAERLEILEAQGKYLIERDDDLELVSNVRNIISAYKSCQLDWYPGLVTYWSHGKRLCEPRPFDFQEFAEVNRKHKGWSGFWV